MKTAKEDNSQFTLQLAIMDAVPVVFFGIAAIMLGVKLRSWVFFVGALLCFLAGFGKVLWKFLIAIARKDVALLGMQLRYVMPAGFLLMAAGVFTAEKSAVSGLLDGARRMPSLFFFIVANGHLRAKVRPPRRKGQLDRTGNQYHCAGMCDAWCVVYLIRT